jgi:hypothetical protein
MKVVVTGSGDDPEPLRSHVRTKAARKRLAERFKNPADNLRLVIVCDMWLTGFDCQGPQSGETQAEVAKRIQNKIGWTGESNVDAGRFLKAFYAALRAHLEARMLFGQRRENKHDGKAPSDSQKT